MLRSIRQRLASAEAIPPWSLTSALLFAFVYVIVWIAAQSFAVAATAGDLSRPTPSALALGALIACILNAIVVFQWVSRRARENAIQALRVFQTPALPLFVVVLLSLGAAWLIDLIGVLTVLKGSQIVPPALEVLIQSDAPAIGWIVAAVTAIVIQPIGEELTYRGLLYPALAARFGNELSILMTSAVFTVVMAVLAGPLPWYALIQPLLMSLWVTGIRAYTQSTQMAMVARAAFGLFFVLSALISVRF